MSRAWLDLSPPARNNTQWLACFINRFNRAQVPERQALDSLVYARTCGSILQRFETLSYSALWRISITGFVRFAGFEVQVAKVEGGSVLLWLDCDA